MERKIESKDIACYFPYGLKIFCEDVSEIESIEMWHSKIYSEWNENEEDEIIGGKNYYEYFKQTSMGK